MAEIDLTINTSNMTKEEKKEYRHQLEAERDKYSAKIKSMYKEENDKQFASNMNLVGRCYKKKDTYTDRSVYGQVVSALSNNVYRVETIEFKLPAEPPVMKRPVRLMGWEDYEGYHFTCGDISGKDYIVRDIRAILNENIEITQEEFYEALTKFHKQIEEGIKKLVIEEQRREI